MRAPLFPLLFFVAPMLLKLPAWKFNCPRLHERRRVGGVEDLGAELQIRRFGEMEVLEDRRIQVAEMRPAHLLDLSTERRVIALSDEGSRGRLSERAGVEPLREVVRAGIEILPGYDVGGATEVGRRGDRGK